MDLTHNIRLEKVFSVWAKKLLKNMATAGRIWRHIVSIFVNKRIHIDSLLVQYIAKMVNNTKRLVINFCF